MGPQDEVTKVLQKFFVFHTISSSMCGDCMLFDADRFIAVQDSLASMLGEQSDRRTTMAAFLELSSSTAQRDRLSAFSMWQLSHLEARGLKKNQILDVLRKTMEARQQMETTERNEQTQRYTILQMARAARQRQRAEGQ